MATKFVLICTDGEAEHIEYFPTYDALQTRYKKLYQDAPIQTTFLIAEIKERYFKPA